MTNAHIASGAFFDESAPEGADEYQGDALISLTEEGLIRIQSLGDGIRDMRLLLADDDVIAIVAMIADTLAPIDRWKIINIIANAGESNDQ